jgi:DNA-binding transcriptional ArsR family regulator
MVEHSATPLDLIFGALSDATRRDILTRVAHQTMTVSEIAESYELSFAAISKHLQVLERAKLVIKRRHGKEQLVQIAPAALTTVDAYLEPYRDLWQGRMDSSKPRGTKEDASSQ